MLDSSTARLLDSLQVLVEHGLVRRAGDEAAPRFTMLETMREYGLQRLMESGEEPAARERHAAWCLDLAERAEPELSGPEQEYWHGRLEAEHDNLRAALAWAIEGHRAEMALRLVAAVWRYWYSAGHYFEARGWIDRALAMPEAVPLSVRARALVGASGIAHYQGDYTHAMDTGEDALAAFEAIGDAEGVATAHHILALTAGSVGDHPRAIAHDEQALAGFRAIGREDRLAPIFNTLGLAAYYQGDFERSIALHEEALALRLAHNDEGGITMSLANLGLTAYAQGDYERAAALQRDALSRRHALRRKLSLAHSFENLGLVASGTKEAARAIRLLAAATALRARIGAPPTPEDWAEIQLRLDEMQAILGEVGFHAAWDEGGAMSLDAAIEYALGDS